MIDKDYYTILGLRRTASAGEIKKAYRELAMRYHPDRNRDNEEWANSRFKEINAAFDVLGDPEKRECYDRFGLAGNAGYDAESPVERGAREDLMSEFDGAHGLDSLDDILGDELQGTGFAAWRFRRRFRGPGVTGPDAQKSAGPPG